MTWALLMLGAYLAGSIPFGLLIGKARGVDVRTKGSGNIGATNVGRVLGKRWGLTCFGLDVLKGLVPTTVAGLVEGVWGASTITSGQAGAWLGVAACSVVGHMFPVWLKFKGGKGVATGLGACLGVHPFLSIPALSSLAVWIACVKATRYVGLSSSLAAVCLPLLVWLWHGMGLWSALTGQEGGGDGLVVFVAGTSVLGAVVLIKHRGNLVRTFRGTEPKTGERAE